jgi:fused signal recognition particle receptor
VILGLVSRLRQGLEKSRAKIGAVVDLALGRGVFDDAAAEEIEEALILADVGPETAMELTAELRDWVARAGGGLTADTVREALAYNVTKILTAADVKSVPLAAAHQALGTPPCVTLIVGVNGTGKTTTAAKLAAKAKAEGKSVVLGAADTFRAAAIDQMKVWGERISVPVVAQGEGADPAAVAFDAVQAGIARKADVVIIDTAGRLHTKVNLMNELEKVVRVVRKIKDPISALLVLDATTGQNGLMQVEVFAKSLPLTGLVITKLDGTAKAGVVVQAVRRFGLPVRYVGVGEAIEDLLPFDADAFGRALVA